MAGRFSLWDPRKNHDYQYIDNTVREMFNVAATSIFVYKYLGINGGTDPTAIQDPLFQENRDRHYDPDVYELLGVHNMQDQEYTLLQFGQIIESDIVYMSFHINDSIRRLGRKLMVGDVFEIPHLRDDALLNEDSPAINKYYKVDAVTREADGYSQTWYPHLYRIKLVVVNDSQDLGDILDQPALDGNGDPITGPDGSITDLGDILSDYNNLLNVSHAAVAEAIANVELRNFETQQFYVVPGDELGKQYPWIFSGDGHPPNGAQVAGTGNLFPLNAPDGTWYLRTDYDPYVLFRKDGPVWRRQEVDYRKKWQAAHRILETFINNTNKTTIQGDTFDTKQALSQVFTKPKADF